MLDVRAKKTTRNADDFKVLLIGAVCAIMIMMGSLIFPRFTEQRWYRDFTRLTPFYDVVLLYSSVSHDNIQVMVGGSMVKRRCTFNGLFGYIYGDNGLRYRVPVNHASEKGGNRPPSDTPESWGPWKISLDGNANIPTTMVPERWEVIAEHVECPTEPNTQRNLFVSGKWGDYLLPSVNVLEELVNQKGDKK